MDAEGGDVTKDELIAVIQDRTRDIISTNPLSYTSLLQQAAAALAASVTVPEGWRVTEFTRDERNQRAWSVVEGRWYAVNRGDQIDECFPTALAAMAALDQEQPR